MRRLRSALTLGLIVTATVSWSGCASAAPAAPDGISEDADQWVVVAFEDREDRFDADLMDLLLDTELAADEALAASGAGAIDGNEVGEHGYELWFVGPDADAIWESIEPVFATAPVPWTQVRLMDSLDDGSPRILTPTPGA